MTDTRYGEKLLTVDDLCGYLGVSKDYIYDEVRKSRLKATKLARQLRFRPTDVDAYIESNAAVTPGTPRRPSLPAMRVPPSSQIRTSDFGSPRRP